MRDEIVRIYKVPIEKISVISTDPDPGVEEVLELYRSVSGGLDGK
jgi:hypothetical protein